MARKKKNEITIRSSAAEYLTFIAATGDSERSFEMRYEDENIWLTQKMLATLYDIEVPTVNYHIKNVFADNELEPEATIRKFLIVQSEGSRQVSREVEHYSLQTMAPSKCRFVQQRYAALSLCRPHKVTPDRRSKIRLSAISFP